MPPNSVKLVVNKGGEKLMKTKLNLNSTRNYDDFKKMVGNRDVVMAHVKILADAIKRNNLSKLIPVLVNEKMEILDGQHRVEAMRLLDQPVYYVVAKGTTLEDVQSLNSSARSWKLSDYIDSYIKLGNKDYEILAAFMENYGLSASLSAGLLGGQGHNTKESRSIMDGTFKVKALKRATEVGDYLSKIKPFIDQSVFQDRNFVSAIAVVLNNPKVSKAVLRGKFTYLGPSLGRQINREEYLRELERIYNFKTRGERVRLF